MKTHLITNIEITAASSGNVSVATLYQVEPPNFHVRAADECNFVVMEMSTSIVLSAETNNFGRDNNRQMSLEGSAFTFTTSGNERLRIANLVKSVLVEQTTEHQVKY